MIGHDDQPFIIVGHDDQPYVLPMAIYLFFTWVGGYGAPEQQKATSPQVTPATLATIEVTWHAPLSGGLTQIQLVGTEGQIVYDPTVTGRVSVSGKFDGPTGGAWSSFAPPWRGGRQPLDHVLDCIEGKATPLATVEDARANVAACLAFYEAARTGQAVTLAT